MSWWRRSVPGMWTPGSRRLPFGDRRAVSKTGPLGCPAFCSGQHQPEPLSLTQSSDQRVGGDGSTFKWPVTSQNSLWSLPGPPPKTGHRLHDLILTAAPRAGTVIPILHIKSLTLKDRPPASQPSWPRTRANVWTLSSWLTPSSCFHQVICGLFCLSIPHGNPPLWKPTKCPGNHLPGPSQGFAWMTDELPWVQVHRMAQGREPQPQQQGLGAEADTAVG